MATAVDRLSELPLALTENRTDMSTAWTEEQLTRIDAAEELEIAVLNPDGTLRGWVPIWVVRHDEKAYVRTWHRRHTGWYGNVLGTGQARVRVPGVEADVTVHDVGPARDAALRAAVDDAYRTKYQRYGRSTISRMTSDDAAESTLRLTPTNPTTMT